MRTKWPSHAENFALSLSIFASGAIPSREAIAYVCAQSKIESLVFGASGGANIRQTKELIDEFSVTT